VFVEAAGTFVLLQYPQCRRLHLGQTEGITRARQEKPTSSAPLMQGVNEQSMDVSDQVRLVVAVFSRTVLTEPNDVVVIY
jgi:hypothetical protein